MHQDENFATRLVKLRNQKGLSKSDLARAVGVSTTCVWNWEEGNTHPRTNALVRIAAALSTTEGFLERGVPPAKAVAAPPTASSFTGTLDRVAVNDVIRRAREEIAAAAGLSVDHVKVVLEYGT